MNELKIYTDAIVAMLDEVRESSIKECNSDRERVQPACDDAATMLIAIRLRVDAMISNVRSLSLQEFKEKHNGKEDS